MKIAVLGTSPMTLECVLEFVKSKWQVVAVVSLSENRRPLNSIDFIPVSNQIGEIYYETDDINDKSTELFFRGLDLDYIFSTWSYIIKENILDIPRYFVIGSHPTQLPYNRGNVKSFNKPYECAVLLYKEYMLRIENADVIKYGGKEWSSRE